MEGVTAHIERTGLREAPVHSVCLAHPAHFPCPVVFCVFSVMSMSCLICAFRERYSVCVFLTFPALPTKFTKGLRKEEATEGATATLHCELSKAAPVEWRKGPETLRAGDRVSLRQDGAVCELEIRGLTEEDAGEYSCVCGQERTSATLTVRGKDHM